MNKKKKSKFKVQPGLGEAVEKPKYVRPPEKVQAVKATHECKACGRPIKSQHENCAQ